MAIQPDDVWTHHQFEEIAVTIDRRWCNQVAVLRDLANSTRTQTIDAGRRVGIELHSYVLAERYGVSRSVVWRCLADLERAGAIVRMREPSGSRPATWGVEWNVRAWNNEAIPWRSVPRETLEIRLELPFVSRRVATQTCFVSRGVATEPATQTPFVSRPLRDTSPPENTFVSRQHATQTPGGESESQLSPLGDKSPSLTREGGSETDLDKGSDWNRPPAVMRMLYEANFARTKAGRKQFDLWGKPARKIADVLTEAHFGRVVAFVGTCPDMSGIVLADAVVGHLRQIEAHERLHDENARRAEQRAAEISALILDDVPDVEPVRSIDVDANRTAVAAARNALRNQPTTRQNEPAEEGAA
jgi:hypothetical protein